MRKVEAVPNNVSLNFIGLNTFFVLIFIMFVANGPHFDIMFKTNV